MCVCVCVCVYVWEGKIGEGRMFVVERGKGENYLIYKVGR